MPKPSSGKRKVKTVSLKSETFKLLNTVAVKLSDLEKGINTDTIKDKVNKISKVFAESVRDFTADLRTYVKDHPIRTIVHWGLFGVDPIIQMVAQKFIDDFMKTSIGKKAGKSLDNFIDKVIGV